MSNDNTQSHAHGHDDLPMLVRMANQIAAAFAHKDDATAVEAIREHIAAFWTRGMRQRITAASDEAVAKLDPRAAQAIATFAAPALRKSA